MSLILRVAIGLVAGLLLGVAITSSHSAWLARIPGFLDPVGTIFVNAIRLAVIPLVVSGLITGTASGGSPRKMGKLSGRALALIRSEERRVGKGGIIPKPSHHERTRHT